MKLSRRPWPALVLCGVLSLSAACSDDGDSAETQPTSMPSAQTPPANTTAPAQEAAFPVTVDHMHGSTVIDEAPQRIVTVGYSDQDFVLAFGVAPIAVTDWYGDHQFATWEWAQDELGDTEPAVLNRGQFTGTAEYNYEQIASLDPDLIIGLFVDMDAQQYERLSTIAPTIAPSGDYPPYGMPWQESTRVVGAALGQPERADELIEEVEGSFAAAAADHPEFDGVEMIVMEMFERGSTFARSAADPRTKFMTSLGFVLPEDIAELAGARDGASISDEQMELIDRDLLVWNVGWEPELRAEIEAKPLYSQLDVVRTGHSMFIEDPLVSGALTWGTVLSLPYALDKLVPQLAAVLET